MVKNDRYNVHKIYTEDQTVTFNNILSFDESTGNTNNEDNWKKINFNITLSVKEWKTIGPITTKYK